MPTTAGDPRLRFSLGDEAVILCHHGTNIGGFTPLSSIQKCMPIVSYVPGMKPDRPLRNVLVGSAYLLCVLALVPFVVTGYQYYEGC